MQITYDPWSGTIKISSGTFPNIKSVSKGFYGIVIKWTTFTISKDSLIEYSIANTDGFSIIFSSKYNVYGVVNVYILQQKK